MPGSNSVFLRKDIPVLVSTCLTGLPARYDGGEIVNEELLALLKDRPWIPVCPEQLGGLPIPRPPNSIVGPAGAHPADGFNVLKGEARIADANGDRTAQFVKGAQAAYALARMVGAEVALFRKNSPSCGSIPGTGSDGTPRPIGVAAALLMERGLKVYEVDGQGVVSEVRELLGG